MSFIIFSVFGQRSTVRNGLYLLPRAPEAMALTHVRASLDVADGSAAGPIELDLWANGVSIFGMMGAVRLTILPGQLTSLASGTPAPVIVNPLIADDASLACNVLAAGVTARGLRVAFYW